MTIRGNIIGGVASATFSIASIPLEKVNAVLTLCSLVVGIVIGVVTLYRIFRHRDNQAIIERLDNIERTCRERATCPK